MGWCVLAVVSAVAAGCAPDLPRELCVDDRFTDEEAALVHDAIRLANAQLGERLGRAVIVDGGTRHDPDGFRFDDLGDDLGTVYVIAPDSAEYRWLADANQRDYEGYATLADVLVAFRLPADAADADRQHLHQIVLHELGHFLGLPHATDRDAIMYSGPDRRVLDSYTATDRGLFCAVYGC